MTIDSDFKAISNVNDDNLLNRIWNTKNNPQKDQKYSLISLIYFYLMEVGIDVDNLNYY